MARKGSSQAIHACLNKPFRTNDFEAFRSAKNPETEPHPKPSSKHIEIASLAIFLSHLNGGVHDPASLGPNIVVIQPSLNQTFLRF